MPLSPADERRRAALRSMKTLALSLLIVAAVIFCISFALQSRYPWLGFVRAAAEGAMVGALADWFAVTALFRRPLGLPIPHTALIKEKKDALGASLSDFVENNFLSEDVVITKLADLDVASRVGGWLTKPGAAERVAHEGATALSGIIAVLDDEAIGEVLESMARKYILDPPWAPPLGRLAAEVFDAGHHHQLVQLLVDRAVDWVRANRVTVTRIVTDRSPNWVPSFVDDMVGDRIYNEVLKFVLAVQSDPHHQVRQALDTYLKNLAVDLQNDPAMQVKVENIKAQLLNSPRVRELSAATWQTLKNALLDSIDDPDSALRQKFVAMLREVGERLSADTDLAGRVNAWISNTVAYVVRNYAHDVSSIITDTVERWDADEASEKIELAVGRDLQFIRINGTVVGAIAGLLIYTAATLIFHT